ncbi:MAG: PHP domain-containing protein [Actinomycetota bacterium]|nr:MAG: PHP domain-containing protein [Actinomycetota bacterium]
MDPVQALEQVAFLLERELASTYKVRAFRQAARVLGDLDPDELRRRIDSGTLTGLAGIGPATAAVAMEAAGGELPSYLRELQQRAPAELAPGGGPLLRQVLGDLHTHSDWSDGGSSIEQMARTAQALGRQYVALTDHSPRLTVARGLDPERLRRQLDVVAALNESLAPFRILTGIEVDIREDGSLDQTPELLARVDVVVASVHSKLRMAADAMTERMVRAVANPHTDVLGHCTGRLIRGRGRPESTFDAAIVFEACRRFDVAVEINSRPERLDPPRRLLRQAVEAGCLVSIDTDAHAPGQLDWLGYGCQRAVECAVPADRIVTTWPVHQVLAWTGRAS